MRSGATGVGRALLGKGLAGLFVIGILAGGALLAVQGRGVASPPALDPPPPQPGVALGKSGLPVPRFVSLKAGRVNVRVGPGEDYKVAWVFTKPALPVEVIQEYDTWRRVRDSDGTVGWVFHSLLSGKRTAVITPWASGDALPIHAKPSSDSAVTAMLQPGVQAAVDRCRGGWCDLSGEGFAGWIQQNQLWGVYANEDVD